MIDIEGNLTLTNSAQVSYQANYTTTGTTVNVDSRGEMAVGGPPPVYSPLTQNISS